VPARRTSSRSRSHAAPPAEGLSSPLDARVAAVRRFNRQYTRVVGALDEGHLRSAYSLAEVRLLFELAQRESATATVLIAELGLDAGYMSRLVRRLERRRLVKRTTSARDARENHLTLTAAGRTAFRALDRDASEEVGRLLAPLDDHNQQRLVESMETITTLLDASAAPALAAEPAYILRPPRAGDLGWVVQRHGELYAREYGWDQRFEALVARVVADWVTGFDASRERCWIAERGGVNVGSVFVAGDADRPGVAKLRLLVVEPAARGLGIGRRLVDECTRFARDAGYHTISLWTNSVLVAARRIYAAAGYRLVREEPHDSFGHPLTAETWELRLRDQPVGPAPRRTISPPADLRRA
jgi:DNA-binding MarR family transcriptional regulator/ribosomal protein S18 acetylase RimI-like enzyme